MGLFGSNSMFPKGVMSQNKPVGEWLDRQKALLNIVGARLTSVQFILNYLILGFDERGAYTTLVWP
jgi:hypothetical protein